MHFNKIVYLDPYFAINGCVAKHTEYVNVSFIVWRRHHKLHL